MEVFLAEYGLSTDEGIALMVSGRGAAQGARYVFNRRAD